MPNMKDASFSTVASSIPIPGFLRHPPRSIYVFSPWANILWTMCRSLFSRKIHEMEIGKLQLHFRVAGEITLDP